MAQNHSDGLQSIVDSDSSNTDTTPTSPSRTSSRDDASRRWHPSLNTLSSRICSLLITAIRKEVQEPEDTHLVIQEQLCH